MYRMVFYTLQHLVDKWIFIATLITVFIIALISLNIPIARYVTRPLIRLLEIMKKILFSDAVQLNIINREKFISDMVIKFCIVFSALFLFGGWAINHYWLPGKFHIYSLMFDGIFLLFALFLGWIMIRYKHVIEVLKEKYEGKLPLIFVFLFLAILNLGVFLDGKINAPKGPNVIIIGVDTLRADHVSSYGYFRKTTPNIDELADHAILFKKAFSSSSWTLPSFQSIFTALYQKNHKVVNTSYRLNKSYNTFAELLKNNGYRTAGFIAGPLLKSLFGFNQGYDVYEESVSSSTNIESHKDITSPRITEMALHWIKKNKDNKFFLFIHYWDPHYDYIPPPPYDTLFDPHYHGAMDGKDFEKNNNINPEMDKRDLQHIVSLYDGEIRWTDMHIEKIFNALKELMIDEDTIIIIVGDHGEEFLEHGRKGHAQSLYNEVIHVPLIIKIPGISERKDIETIVSTVDIMPTVLSVLDIKSPSVMDGENLMPIINGTKTKRNEEEVFSELFDSLVSVVNDRWKLIYNYKSYKYEFYDIKTDVLEKNNLVSACLKDENALKEKMADWLKMKKTQDRRRTAEVKKDRETLRQLKSLGYIQ